MLADPQVLPLAVPVDLDRISSALGRFGSSDLKYELAVDHSRAARGRHVAKLTARKISADPLLPTQNREYTMSVHTVIDHPLQGFSSAEIVEIVDAFVDYLTTAGLVADFVQGQA